jgi:hypothetical protein
MEARRRDNRLEVAMVDIDTLAPKAHLLRKVERIMDYAWLYERLSPYYCHDNVDPVVLVKMVLIQHLFGIPSLRQTHREIVLNVALSIGGFSGAICWIPHFATVNYAFCKRFPSELVAEIFEHILNKALKGKKDRYKPWEYTMIVTSAPEEMCCGTRRRIAMGSAHTGARRQVQMRSQRKGAKDTDASHLAEVSGHGGGIAQVRLRQRGLRLAQKDD